MQRLLRDRQLLANTVLFLAGIVLIAACWVRFSPDITRVTEMRNGKEVPVRFPINRPSDGEYVDLRITLELSGIRPTRFRMPADDCIQSMAINGRRVGGKFPDCDTTGRPRDLGSYLRTGKNTLDIRLRDFGGILTFDIVPSLGDPLVTVTLLIIIAWIGWFAFILATRRSDVTDRLLLAAIFFGSLLRVFYGLLTKHSVRAYDWDGHIEYVDYIAQHLHMPPAQGGWEFYQPPLYYLITGVWVRIGTVANRARELILDDVRGFSILISIASLGALLWIGRTLLKNKTGRWEILLYAGLCAVFPGLVFFASRITNDTLFILVSLLWFGFLLKWWSDRKAPDWYASCALLGLSLLTKSNALPYIPVMALCMVICSDLSWKTRVRLSLIGGGIVAAIAGWFFVLRFGIERETFIVGNRLNHDLQVKNTLGHLASFNPFRLLAIPYAGNWSDASGRQFFWEYLFKSGHVGEWDFGIRLRGLTMLTHLLGLGVCGLAACGIVREVRRGWRRTFPLLCTLLLLLAAAFAYRVQSPFSPNQDYRFIPLVVVPLFYYAVRGRGVFPRSGRTAADIMLVGYIAAASLFILLVANGA